MQIADLINVFITAFVYLLFSLFISSLYLFAYLFMLSIYCKYLFNNALYVCVKLKTFFWWALLAVESHRNTKD